MEQGQKFRLIRKQRHLTIKQLAEVASSVASISDFENGKTSLSNDNLFKLLRYLRVEYNEFFDNDLLLDKSFQELANDFNKAMFEKDVASLEKCCHAFEQLGNNNPIDKIISLCIQCQIHQLQHRTLDNEVIETLRDYFFSLDIWTNVDISLLDMAKTVFNVKTLTIFMNEIMASINHPPRNNLDRIKVDSVGSCIFYLIKIGESAESRRFLPLLEELKFPDYFALQSLYLKELESAYHYCFKNKSNGLNLHQKVLKTLEFIELKGLAEEWDTDFKSAFINEF